MDKHTESPRSLPERTTPAAGVGPSGERMINIPIGTSLREAEKQILQETLAAVGQNKSEAARVLKLSRRGLQKKLLRMDGG